MYTESLSGNLLGAVPITFTPKFPPPLTLPTLFFTDVTVIQAAQFGGDLTVPGMKVLPGPALLTPPHAHASRPPLTRERAVRLQAEQASVAQVVDADQVGGAGHAGREAAVMMTVSPLAYSDSFSISRSTILTMSSVLSHVLDHEGLDAPGERRGWLRVERARW